MRKASEVRAEHERLTDLLWYARHMDMGLPEGVPADIAASAEANAARIAQTVTPEMLEDIQHGAYAVGVLHGKVMTLRWMLGMGWDDEGILDS
jgi:hypothetical protein